ncbi:translocation/assembly module TamB domain-containing protein [Acidovorax sacchari]|uniref:translocation/assembly module TamB domain-containing protein n=1 Tax=Acidovorax sacchari TaxID=3230736 RepID=UPI0039E59D4B
MATHQTPNPYAAAAAPPPRPRRRRALRIALWSLASLIALLLVLLAAAWWWTGTGNSLATALAQAARYLPAGQTLETRDVSGSVRAGGQIGWLRWSSPTLTVEVQDARIGWSLPPLLQRELSLGEVHAARIVATPRTPAEPEPEKPVQPLEQLVLPLRIDIPLRVDEITWAAASPITVRNLAGRYRFDGDQHSATLDNLELAQGRYSGSATLQALAPMALELTADGVVRTPAPGGGADLEATARAEVRGTLATAAARLDVSGRLQAVAAQAAAPQRPTASAPRRAGSAPRPAPATPSASVAASSPAGTAPSGTEAMQAQVQARIAPWAPQPLLQAQAQVQALDVAAIWPQAPVTRLSGRVEAAPAPATAPGTGAPQAVPQPAPAQASAPASAASAPSPSAGTPPATGWALSAQLENALPGPWDKGRLPVESIDARADFDGARWTVPQATARVGSGTIALEGAFTPATRALQGDLELRGVRPDAVLSTLDAAPLSGRARARSDGAPAADNDAAPAPLVRFSADIRSAGAARAPRKGGTSTAQAAPPLRIDRLATEGTWQGTLLTLAQLQMDALQVQASARQLRIDTAARSAQGQLQATLPGATAQVDGRIAPRAGAGTLDLRVADAQRVQRWIESVPGLGTALGGAALQGEARLDARWNGGWESLLGQLQAAGLVAKPWAGAATTSGPFELQARLAAPRWEVALPPRPGTGAGPATVRLTAVRADVAGSVPRATLSLDGEARLDERRLDLRLRGSGGSAGPGQWRAQIDELRLQARDGQRPGPWTVQFAQPLTVSARTAPTLQVETSGGQARVSAPAPGDVTLRWEPVHFARTAAGSLQLRTRGQLQGLPMAWAEALAQGSDALDRLGVQGNLVFDGDWDVDAGDTLRASASLRRTSGDLRLLTGNAPAATVVRSSGPSTGTGTGPAAGMVRGTAAAANASATDTPRGAGTPAGVRAAEVRVQAEGDTVRARLQWDSERAGQVQAEASTRLARVGEGWEWPADAPLSATARARLPDVGVWSTLAPPGWRVQGTLDADVVLSGTRTAPRWSGTLAADQLAVRSLLDGVDLQNGRLRAALRGDRLEITEFRVNGGPGSSARIAGFSGNRTAAPKDGGTLSGTGTMSWAGMGQQAAAGSSGIAMDFTADARALQVLVRADRQVSVSGQVRAQLRQGQLSLRGKLTADRATIILAEAGAPSLGSDVVVRSAATDRARAEAAQREGAQAGRVEAARPPDIALTFDLGDDFALQGHGVTTRLAGELEIRGATAAGGPPRITGEVRTVEGRYRAWGQALNIETGLARFNGPYDNPALDVLAIRPNISVRAGVQVTGTAKAPRVALYSDPDLPDAEKLSWVVLGRSTAAGGAEAALLQQAALALLGGGGGNAGAGNFASRLGLDEIGFRGPNSGASGEDASGAALTFGKRLSKDLYVTYERSLSGALGTLYIFYDLTQRLTLRGQTGVQSAVDLIYTLRYD